MAGGSSRVGGLGGCGVCVRGLGWWGFVGGGGVFLPFLSFFPVGGGWWAFIFVSFSVLVVVVGLPPFLCSILVVGGGVFPLLYFFLCVALELKTLL